jgi:CcmD family protein
MEITPDTTSYMIGGFVFIFSVLGLYVASLITRRRNLTRELEILQQIEAPDYDEIGGEAVSPG